jgi:hypothetical protein
MNIIMERNMNNEVEGMWKEAAVTYVEALL